MIFRVLTAIIQETSIIVWLDAIMIDDRLRSGEPPPACRMENRNYQSSSLRYTNRKRRLYPILHESVETRMAFRKSPVVEIAIVITNGLKCDSDDVDGLTNVTGYGTYCATRLVESEHNSACE
ncbi:hypothetical protein DBV15_06080 [Temnothorax longispinosus]|uniref:Uncharacterized protein n=1 Tax=Temnothorax longispinosus TaxID=300112 RepID=A0A4S2KGZ1_9HYME|nr:hypothetical protein DBV15_06080 [Temnothorax longispinosus]